MSQGQRERVMKRLAAIILLAIVSAIALLLAAAWSAA
jgi:hypothetical protein